MTTLLKHSMDPNKPDKFPGPSLHTKITQAKQNCLIEKRKKNLNVKRVGKGPRTNQLPLLVPVENKLCLRTAKGKTPAVEPNLSSCCIFFRDVSQYIGQTKNKIKKINNFGKFTFYP